MANENVIRDRLSEDLDILEPGLTLVEKNHRLPNHVGAKGFIDILARDKLGNLIIIELKRSDQAARQALFEIIKYISLFRREHGTPAHRIRCFIVSTTWHELLVPYSEFRRLCETQTEGFKIEADLDGNVLKAEKVFDTVEDAVPEPFRTHVAYLYPTSDARVAALPMLRDSYMNAGAQGYLLLQVDHQGDDQRVIYPFGAYFVPTRLKPSLRGRLTDEATADLKETEGDTQNPDLLRESVENRFLAIVQESIVPHFHNTDLESSIGGPESFTAMLGNGWCVVSIARVGPFASVLVMPDLEVIALVKGLAGDSNVHYSRLASPKHKLDWEQVGLRAQNCLHGNPTWEMATRWFIAKLEMEFPDGTTCLNIYNPLMLPESLYRFAVQNDPRYLPQLAFLVASADGSRNEGVVGTVVWDGRTIPKSVDEVFEAGFCGGINEYYLLKTVGTAWQLDEELMLRHGLEYDMWWLSFTHGKIEKRKRLTVNSDGRVEEAASQRQPSSLTDYLDAIATEPYLGELFAQINRTTSR